MEKQIGKNIRILRIDNGGEFESRHFEDFCKEARIKRQLTMPYNPQQNRVAERKNRTLCKAAKAMMYDIDLPVPLWEEATRTAVYIQNRCLHAILKDKTPEEIFTREKPEVGHLIIFGFQVYIHVPKENRRKMEPSGKKGVFVGYSETSKSYRIYIPSTRLIEVSRDVTFHEDSAFWWSRELPVVEEENVDIPTVEKSDPEFDIQRENEPDEILEPTRIMEISLDDPPFKRRPAWYRETLQDA